MPRTGQLFDTGPDVYNGLAHPQKPCVPAPIGSGPDGETCGTCDHRERPRYHDKVYIKCGLMEDHWTHGAASDIKAGWSACKLWRAIG